MTKKAPKLRPPINRLISRQIISLLEEFFNEKHEPLIGNKISDWLYEDNPELGMVRPITYIMADNTGKKVYKLLDFVKTMIEENQRSKENG